MYTVYKFTEELRLVTDQAHLRRLYRGLTPLKSLGKRELHVLEVLLEEPNQSHTRSEIFEKVWGNLRRSEAVVTTAISKIRKIFTPEQHALITSAPGRADLNLEGTYAFVGQVEVSEIAILPTRGNRIRSWISGTSTNKVTVDGSGESPLGMSAAASFADAALPGPSLTDRAATPEPASPEPSSEENSTSPTSGPISSIARTKRSLFRADQRFHQWTGIVLITAFVVIAILIWRDRTNVRSQALQIRQVIRQSKEIHSPIVTDGTQLYFPECVSGRMHLARVNVQANETESTPLDTTLTNPDLADISPDGNYLLVRELPRFETDTAPFYKQPTDGRPPIRLGNIQGLDGTWSRDQQRIYFGDDDKIYVANSDGVNPRVFIDHLKGRPFWLRWSPNGQVLRFSLIQGHINTLWEVTLPDLQPKQLNLIGDGGDFWCCGNWNSTGALYFYQTRVNGVFQIWKRLEPSGKLEPFEQQLEDYRGPTPARDENVLFARSETRRAELEEYDKKAGGTRPILPTISISTAAVSPNGEWIAYSTFPNRGLYISRRDGTQRRLLTAPEVEAVLPVWSPRGDHIAYMARTRGFWEVYLVSSQGGDAAPLLNNNRIEVRDPSWSRDGQHLLIGYGPVTRDNAESTALYTVDMASRALGERIPNSEGLFSPRWSPDGRYIAALNVSASKLFIYDEQTGWHVIIENAHLGYPNWSSDSKSLFVLDSTATTNMIKRVHVPERTVEMYADLEGNQQPCAMFGTWIGIDGDTPLFVRDTSTRLIGAFKYGRR